MQQTSYYQPDLLIDLYIPQEQNVIQKIFMDNFETSKTQYDVFFYSKNVDELKDDNILRYKSHRILVYLLY